MAIDEAVIREFLYHELKPAPPVKGGNPQWLRQLIHDNLGVHYNPVTAPRPPQLEGLALAVHLERCFLFYGMRMGKTKIALDWISLLKQAGRLRYKSLIITHAPVGTTVWVEEAKKHSHLQVLGVLSGPDSMDRLLDAVSGPADAIVMSWSTLSSICGTRRIVQRGVRKGDTKTYVNLDFTRQLAELFDLVVIDEIHRCRNYMSLWFSIATELVKHCRYRLGLSGTPIGRDATAIWAQAFLIDNGRALSRNYHFFEAAFCNIIQINMRGRQVDMPVFDKKKMPLLQAKIDTFSLSYKLEDTTEINKITNTINLQMTMAQDEEYRKILDRIIANEGLAEDERDDFNSFSQLRQVSSGFIMFDHNDKRAAYRINGNAKLAWLRELAQNIGDVQVVVFHEFVVSGQMICEMLDEVGISYTSLRGETTNKPKAINRFKSGDAQWLICNSQSGSMSIDLPMADYLLFYECPVSPIIRAQAEARPLSRGSKPVVIDDLVCSGVERKILQFMREGKTMLASMLDAREELGFIRNRRR